MCLQFLWPVSVVSASGPVLALIIRHLSELAWINNFQRVWFINEWIWKRWKTMSNDLNKLFWVRLIFNKHTCPNWQENVIYKGCIHLAHDGGDWKRKRHIRVANSYLYEEVTIHKTIAIKYVRSDKNCADMMTKCLSAPLFRKHRSTLMGRV